MEKVNRSWMVQWIRRWLRSKDNNQLLSLSCLKISLNPGLNLTIFLGTGRRTAERRERQNARVWQTWRGHYLRVLSGIQLTLMFLALVQKDLFNGMSSLVEGFFKQNYCHACHTRFAVDFPLPSFCVSSLIRQERKKTWYRSLFCEDGAGL